MNFVSRLAAAAALTLGLAAGAQASFVNGSFEDPLGGGAESTSDWTTRDFVITSQANVTGWRTTAASGNIEIWRQPGPDATPTPAYLGSRFAELNADTVGALYQDVTGIAAGSIVGWELAHRGRSGLDTMRLTITDMGADNALGGGDDTVLFTSLFTDGNTAWGFHQGTGLVAVGNTVRFEFGAVSTSSGNNSIGNFLDAVDFGVGVGQRVPEPASLLLVGAALAAAGVASRRRAG